ncbi:MAG: hypothetical protein WC091_01905 [Sulfuricellaceae bacterium]
MLTNSTLRFHALISGIAFLAALVILSLLLWKAETLVRLGLVGKLYYLVLVPLGLCAAAFLFGALKSYAAYRGQALGGMLELGGPVVAFVLVLALGFMLTPDPSGFSVTVFAHRENPPTEPFRSGKLVLELGGDPRTAVLADNGAAYFIGIPATFKGQRVKVRLQDAPGYEIAQDSIKLDGEGVALAVRPQTAVFKGHIRTTDGRPLHDARVSLAGHAVTTDTSGYFMLKVPGVDAENGATLSVTASGYAPWSSHVNPGGNEITAMLEKE